MNQLREIIELCNDRMGVFPGGEVDRLLDEIRGRAQDHFDEENKELVWLRCLENAGVDNWPGCDYAAEMMRKKYGDDW